MSGRNFEDIEDDQSDEDGLDLKKSKSSGSNQKSRRKDDTRTFEGKDTSEIESKEPDRNGNNLIDHDDHESEEVKQRDPIGPNHISLNFNYAKLHESLTDFKKAIIKDK